MTKDKDIAENNPLPEPQSASAAPKIQPTESTPSLEPGPATPANAPGNPPSVVSGVPLKKCDFFLEKIIPNFLIWFTSYVIIGKVVQPRLNINTPINWDSFIDISALFIFASGSLLTIAIAYGISKGAPSVLSWMFKRTREEASSAMVNLCSLGVILGFSTGNISLIITSVAGYCVAYMAL